MLSPKSIDRYITFRQTFNSIPETLEKKLTVTGTLDVQKGEYRTLSQNQKLTYTDTNIGNFGTAPFSARIITKINSFTNIGSVVNALIFKGTAATGGFGILIKSLSVATIYCNTATADINITALDNNKYYDFVLTRNGTTARLYINGIDVGGVTTANIGLTVNQGSFQISADSGTSRYIKQSVKLVELYNKALGADEVKTLYNNSKFKNYNSVMYLSKWIKGTGVYTETYQTTANTIVPIGQKIFTCGTSGTLFFPSKQASGTWEFSIYKGNDSNTFIIGFISDRNNTYSNFLGYSFVINTSESVQILKTNNGSTNGTCYSTTSYVLNNTWYRIKITRSIAGVFTMYIKGGSFGTSYVLVSTAGGGGSNPATENTYTTSNFIVIDNDAGDQISDIRFTPYIK